MATSGRKLPPEDRERIQKLRDAGLSVREIANAQRLSPTTVQKNLRNGIAK